MSANHQHSDPKEKFTIGTILPQPQHTVSCPDIGSTERSLSESSTNRQQSTVPDKTRLLPTSQYFSGYPMYLKNGLFFVLHSFFQRQLSRLTCFAYHQGVMFILEITSSGLVQYDVPGATRRWDGSSGYPGRKP